MAENNNQWIHPETGVAYELITESLPELAYNDEGKLLYSYSEDQEKQALSIASNGNLQIQTNYKSYIDDDGNLVLYRDIAGNVYTTKDLELLRSRNKEVRLKAVLLDEHYNNVGDLVGSIKSASYDITSDSDIRRICSLTLHVHDKVNLNSFESIWIDHMVELSIGILDFSNNEYVWYPLGRMLMKSGSFKYNATSQEVKMSLVDLMANIAEDRGSQMGLEYVAKAGSNIRTQIIAILTTFSRFKKYSVPEFEDVVPYDITVGIGKYPLDALKELLNLFPYYEMFYDNDGVFTVQMIPTKIDDPVDIDFSIIDEILIDIEKNSNFNVVRNTTEIWGRELDPMYMSLSCTTENGVYKLTIDDTFKNLVSGDTYGFVPDTSSVIGQKIQIQDTEVCSVCMQTGNNSYVDIEEGAIVAGVPYVIKYLNLDKPRFVLQGEMLIHVIIQEIDQLPSEDEQKRFKTENACNDVQWIINPESPFACSIEPTTGRIIREIRQVFEGGEYTNIYTTQLAYERARYENWLKTRVQDTVTLQMLLVPWMDVNQKISYTSPITGEVEVLIVQSISYDFQKWTMTVKGQKFYPYYPW